MLRGACLAMVGLLAAPAWGVIVRGHVTTPLGQPLPGSRVQLISLSGGPRNVASGIAGVAGEYELRSNRGGRFLLLTSASPVAPLYAPQIGTPFYAGRADLMTLDIALSTAAITPQLSSQSTLLPVPLAQLASRTWQAQADQLLTDATPLGWLGQAPGALVVQRGQVGAPATLYLRGAPVTGVSVNGVTAEPLGSPYDLGGVGTAGLAAVESVPALELTATPLPVRFLDAQAGVLGFANAGSQTVRPALTYVGDGGNLSSTRSEAIVSATRMRADALGSFARFNTDNDLPAGAAHLISWAANVGYHVSGATSLRAVAREDVNATPLALPFAIYGVQPAGRRGQQNLYASFTYETRSLRGWHNVLSYGLGRGRAQTFRYTLPTAGVPVTVTGANGYSASGTALFAVEPARQDLVTNRDEYTYRTDYPLRTRPTNSLAGLLTVRFQDERAVRQEQYAPATTRVAAGRAHWSGAGVLQGQVRHRLFVEASGFVDQSDLLGVRGAPRLGVTYVPVRPGAKRLGGTSIHLALGSGLREPSLLEQAAMAQPAAGHARTLEAGVEQGVAGQKLTVRATYFHNQFSHESELISISPVAVASTLAYRTQGAEVTGRYQLSPRLLATGTYDYLASVVEQTSTQASFNPGLPGVRIGALSALAGARPFHRPPQSGSFAVEYTGTGFTASLRGVVASRSDDSTNLPQSAGLLLPNRDLAPWYVALDAAASYAVSRHATAYVQMNNLLDDRSMAPLGYLSTPFQVRAGLRIRLGGE